MQVRLEVARNKANVKKVVLRSDVVIGRSPECNLRIASNEVSRQHCRLLVTPAGVLVRDLGSSNGTFVNGARAAPETDVPVPPGAQLSIGGIEFIVRYELPDESTAESDVDQSAETPASGTPPVAVAADAGPEPDDDVPSSPASDPFFAVGGEPSESAESDEFSGHQSTATFNFLDAAVADPSDDAPAEQFEPAPAADSPSKRRSLFGLFGRKKSHEEPTESAETPAPAPPAPVVDAPAAPDPAEDLFGGIAEAPAGDPAHDEDDDLGDFLKQLGQ